MQIPCSQTVKDLSIGIASFTFRLKKILVPLVVINIGFSYYSDILRPPGKTYNFSGFRIKINEL
jgi:hypothetical protein